MPLLTLRASDDSTAHDDRHKFESRLRSCECEQLAFIAELADMKNKQGHMANLIRHGCDLVNAILSILHQMFTISPPPGAVQYTHTHRRAAPPHVPDKIFDAV